MSQRSSVGADRAPRSDATDTERLASAVDAGRPAAEADGTIPFAPLPRPGSGRTMRPCQRTPATITGRLRRLSRRVVRLARCTLPGAAAGLIRYGRLQSAWRRDLKSADAPGMAATRAVPATWDSGTVEGLREALPAEHARLLLSCAERFCRHEFDLLGSGPTGLGAELPWDTDWKSGARYPRLPRPLLTRLWEVLPGVDRGADIKVPWELGRFQHLPCLAQAYASTGDERYAREAAVQLRDFIVRCPPERGVQWLCTMDVALRAVSWVWSYPLLRGADAWESGLDRLFLLSCRYHGAFIAAHLEVSGVVGNHYLADLAGLAFLGLGLPFVPGADGWANLALSEMWIQALRQFRADGTNFEASIPYHRLSAEIVLVTCVLAEAAGRTVPPAVWSRLERALEFVLHYTRPDGGSPQIGDCDDGRALVLSEETRTAKGDHRYLLSMGAVLFGRGDFASASGGLHPETLWLLGPNACERFARVRSAERTTHRPCSVFPDGGYAVLRGRRAHLVMHAGPNGQDGNGGHAHNDALSFELSMDGAPLIVDPGTFCYTSDYQTRDAFRATGAHSTVMVDGHEICPLPARRVFALPDVANACLVEQSAVGGPAKVAARHGGYARLARPVAVVREVETQSDGAEWCVTDHLEGTGERRWTLSFQLAPGVAVRGLARHTTGASVELVMSGGTLAELRCWSCSGVQCCGVALDPAWVSPSYGTRIPAARLRVSFRGALPALVQTVVGAVSSAPADCRAGTGGPRDA